MDAALTDEWVRVGYCRLRSVFDQLPGWVLFVGTVIVFAVAAEIGIRLARWRRKKPADDDRKSHSSVLLAAILALLGLSLAFSFSMAETRFAERRALVLEEANAIGTTYLRATLLPEPHSREARELLRQYVDIRDVPTPEALAGAMERSQPLHNELWAVAVAASEEQPDPMTALFVQSLNQLIDLHEDRTTVILHQRLPGAILLTLYLVALLAMGTLGYSVGLTRTRPILPSLAVIAAVAIVLLLIVELDRPFERVFEVDQAALDDVRETVSRSEAVQRY